MKNSTTDYRPSFFDRPVFAVVVSTTLFLTLLLILYFIDFVPGLTGLNVRIYSGMQGGGYSATVEKLGVIAAKKKGKITNFPTQGSLENLKLLAESSDGNAFALAQNGLPIPEGLELVTRLSKSETVFFLGRNAGSIKTLAGLRGKRIGIGPEGSGAAHFARKFHTTMHLDTLQVTLTNYSLDEQMRLLKTGGLDLAILVFTDNAEIIEQAILKDGLQFATFRQGDSFAKRLPFLRTSSIREGYFDPIRNIPDSDKPVLKLDTMVLCKKGTRRSQIIGLLSAIQELQPDLINFNNTIPNLTGAAYTQAAKDYFANQGPEVYDRYAPRLMDFMPLGNLVQILMAISVLFNLLNVANRFFLWRLDANRVDIESGVHALFGRTITAEEIAIAEVLPEHKSPTAHATLDALIERLARLGTKCRKQSLSLLVPMGKEQSYRYQEEIINRTISAMKAYRQRME